MIIVTNVAGRVEHGPYNITKREFLELKQKHQNEGGSTILKDIEEFLLETSDFTKTEIYTLARFFIRTDFTIEE